MSAHPAPPAAEASPSAVGAPRRRVVVSTLKVIILAGIVAVLVYWFRFRPMAVAAHDVEQRAVVAEAMATPELFGGEPQRVAIARALANRPGVVLADEPTAALDGHRGRQVMELFRKVAHEQGAGIIVATHDQRALDVFDVIYEMEDGVIERGTPTTAEAGPAIAAWR